LILALGLGWYRSQIFDQRPAPVYQEIPAEDDVRKSSVRAEQILSDIQANQAKEIGDLSPDSFPFGFCPKPGEPQVDMKREISLEQYRVLESARRLAHSPKLGKALKILASYLENAPHDRPAYQKYARLYVQNEIQRDFKKLRGRGLWVLYHPSVDRDLADEVLDFVDQQLDKATALTGTSRIDDMTVVIYGDRSELLAVTCGPKWAGAIYDGTMRLHAGSLERTKRWKTIIAHESVHAQLASLEIGFPYWFNEGLAQYFAGQFSEKHIGSYLHMLHNKTYIPFSSMDGRFSELPQSEDAKLAYHQSLAMIHLLLDQAGPRAIAKAIKQLKKSKEIRNLYQQVTGRPLDGQTFLSFLTETHDENWEKFKP
jgi:hypothetical protein